MRRRSVLALLAGAATLPPFAARAAGETAKVFRPGMLLPLPPGSGIRALVQQLHVLGWDEGRNLQIDYAQLDNTGAERSLAMAPALVGRDLWVAIEAGVDSIKHGCYLDENPGLLDTMAQREIFFVPTFALNEYHRKLPLPHVSERAHDLMEHHVESLRRAMAAGVKIAAGTDDGGHGHPSNEIEIECLVKAGLTPLQALRADRLGRRMSWSGSRHRHSQAGQARRSGRRQRRPARRCGDAAGPRAHCLGDEGRRIVAKRLPQPLR